MSERTERQPDPAIRVPAPAKINLALHVTGRRADGYHLLDTLVAFAAAGDKITVHKADRDSFTVSGPYADALGHGDDNLVIRARDALRAATGATVPRAHIHLEKLLPVASGMGGGSADAGAVLTALARLSDPAPEPQHLHPIAASLGADVPMCLHNKPLTASGIGDVITPLSRFPRIACLLVNCGAELSTPAVFNALEEKQNPAMTGFEGGFCDREALFAWLGGQRNDLQAVAERLEPGLGETLALLNATDARLVRMTGSGVTCFALFDDDAAAARAHAALTKARPGWYVQATHLQGTEP